jgi:hypothetical protein
MATTNYIAYVSAGTPGHAEAVQAGKNMLLSAGVPWQAWVDLCNKYNGGDTTPAPLEIGANGRLYTEGPACEAYWNSATQTWVVYGD